MSRITLALAILALSPRLFSQGPPPPPLPVPPVPVPAGNPITAAKTRLGMSLFWDEQLSSTRTVACGSCHIPASGGSDPRSGENLPASRHPGPDGIFGTGDDVVGSPGVPRSDAHGLYLFDPSFGLSPQVTARKANSSINAAFAPELFWDGRATTEFRDPVSGNVVLASGAALESQVLGPPLSEVEMAHVGRGWQDVTARIGSATPLALAENVPASLADWIGRRSYAKLFDEAFGTPDVTAVRIAMAIATYERTLVSDQSRLDSGTLNPQEQQGRQIFNSPQSRCRACHSGPLFTDDQFHYTGVRPAQEDVGRQAVTGLPQDRGRFRTPGLRNVGLREPLFHNGRMATLEDVVDFYNRGGDFNAPNKSPLVVPLPDLEVVTDLAALRRVLSNLLGNALDHASPGSPVRVEARRDEGDLLLSVSNRAENVSPEVAERALEPFWRGDPAHSDTGHVGLGLALCREIVELLGGAIEVSFEEGVFRATVRLFR